MFKQNSKITNDCFTYTNHSTAKTGPSFPIGKPTASSTIIVLVNPGLTIPGVPIDTTVHTNLENIYK